MTRLAPLFAIACWLPLAIASAEEPDAKVAEIAKSLRELDGRVIVVGEVKSPPLAGMLAKDADARLRAANAQDRRRWREIGSKESWESKRSSALWALQVSLGSMPPTPFEARMQVTGRAQGDGYLVENWIYAGRFGQMITANLYRPTELLPSMPGVLVCHSHQSTKHSGARQDLAMTLARAGCWVLVPDHLGHGERQQHPFGDHAPHDYHFRYDLGLQLQLAGDSLMGHFAWDLKRGVDVLLGQPRIDKQRVVLISEPAGGGDVAAVTAALDPRITCAMIQNFGGPQPETPYPLPRDAEDSFNFFGSGSWESTRNLRCSAQDHFAPWLIVGSIAPRRVIYFHEFYWDRDSDPVWPRLQKISDLYGAKDSLAGIGGRGFVVGSAPENTHWLAENRELLYPQLAKWLDLPNLKKEYSQRRPEGELLCLTPEVRKQLEIRPVRLDLAKEGEARRKQMREIFARKPLTDRQAEVRRRWQDLLGGEMSVQREGVVQGLPNPKQTKEGFTVERIHLSTEPGIVVPVVLLLPQVEAGKKSPLVMGVAQQGKQAFLRERAEEIAKLLSHGVAVALPDVRGTGESSPGDDRDRRSAATSISATHWMLGETLLLRRLIDLRLVKRHLLARPELDKNRIAIWGDSFAKVNPPETKLEVPYTAANRPALAEPLGGLLALTLPLYENDLRAIAIRGGLSDYASLLDGPCCYVPHDAIVPSVLREDDLVDLAFFAAPRPILLEGLVDGQNRRISQAEAERRYAFASSTYEAKGAAKQLRLDQQPSHPTSIADWLIAELGK